MRKLLLAGAILALPMLAKAAPVYIGLQEAGVNSGAITTENNGNGSAAITNLSYGTFVVSASALGTPPLPEPDLLSNTIDVSSSSAGILKVYVTELNQFPIGSSFLSSFTSNLINGSITSVVEQTYANPCSGGLNQPCVVPTDLFNTSNLLSTATFTAIGTIVKTAAFPGGINAGTVPYSTTEVFTITAASGFGDTNNTIDLTDAVPEPASLAILSVGMIGLGALRRRRLH